MTNTYRRVGEIYPEGCATGVVGNTLETAGLHLHSGLHHHGMLWDGHPSGQVRPCIRPDDRDAQYSDKLEIATQTDTRPAAAVVAGTIPALWESVI